ncbi:MAG: sigma-70 family RNA polymerase sigma factor [Oscillospiraceae bacterium]|nr:sigma-70 family RNA polymerase sigma factor [Oscillospiraceae bacterium]
MNDEALIALFLRRDEEAIRLLEQKYGAYCLAIATRLVGREIGEECLNTALGSVWDSIPPNRPQNLKLYFAAIARNLALNRRQQEHAKKRGGGDADAVFEELAQCIAAGSTPEGELLQKELRRSINDFLGKLPARQRDVFLRRYFFAEQTGEIAARYAMRESNVLLILSRTRKKLKEFLEAEGYFK